MKFAILLLLLMLVQPAIVWAQPMGVVDYRIAMEALPEYQAGQAKINLKTAELKDSLTLLIKSFMPAQTICGPISTTAETTTSIRDHINSELEKIKNAVTEFEVYSEHVLGEMQRRLDIRTLNIVTEALKRFRIQKQIRHVMDKKSVLYCLACTDMTAEFIAYCNRIR